LENVASTAIWNVVKIKLLWLLVLQNF